MEGFINCLLYQNQKLISHCLIIIMLDTTIFACIDIYICVCVCAPLDMIRGSHKLKVLFDFEARQNIASYLGIEPTKDPK